MNDEIFKQWVVDKLTKQSDDIGKLNVNFARVDQYLKDQEKIKEGKNDKKKIKFNMVVGIVASVGIIIGMIAILLGL